MAKKQQITTYDKNKNTKIDQKKSMNNNKQKTKKQKMTKNSILHKTAYNTKKDKKMIKNSIWKRKEKIEQMTTTKTT